MVLYTRSRPPLYFHLFLKYGYAITGLKPAVGICVDKWVSVKSEFRHTFHAHLATLHHAVRGWLQASHMWVGCRTWATVSLLFECSAHHEHVINGNVTNVAMAACWARCLLERLLGTGSMWEMASELGLQKSRLHGTTSCVCVCLFCCYCVHVWGKLWWVQSIVKERKKVNEEMELWERWKSFIWTCKHLPSMVLLFCRWRLLFLGQISDISGWTGQDWTAYRHHGWL